MTGEYSDTLGCPMKIKVRDILQRLVLALAIALIVPVVLSAEITLSSAGKTVAIRSAQYKTGEYVALMELFDALGGRTTWNQLAKTLSVDLAGHHWRFQLFSPFVGIDGDPYNLVYPLRFQDDAIMAPLATLAPLLDAAHPMRVVWQPEQRMLIIETEQFNILEHRIERKKNGLLLELVTTRPLKFEAFASEGNWLNITLFEGQLDPGKFNRRYRSSLVREVKAYQFDQSAQVSFRFARNPGAFVTGTATEPDRLQIIFEDTTFFPDYPTPPNIQMETNPEPIDLIVIDPGHGGKDSGAIGRKKKTKEKDIVLRIGKYLKELIDKDKTMRAIITRHDDRFIPLHVRAKIANDAGADLFISIHANASPKAKPRGCQTFFLARAKNDDARAVAQLENAALQYEDNGPADTSVVNFILLDMIQTEFQRESADLAELVQKEFEHRLKIPSRGVDQAGFVVLNKVYMPAVLVESAFISNEKEEKLLRKKSFQKKVAEAIYRSIKSFKKKYDPAY